MLPSPRRRRLRMESAEATIRGYHDVSGCGPAVTMKDEVMIKEEAITIDHGMITDVHHDEMTTPSSSLPSTHQPEVKDEADIHHDGGPAVLIKEEVMIEEEAITVDHGMMTVDHQYDTGTPSTASTHQPEVEDDADILHGAVIHSIRRSQPPPRTGKFERPFYADFQLLFESERRKSAVSRISCASRPRMKRRRWMPDEISFLIEDLERQEENDGYQNVVAEDEEDFDGSDIEGEEPEIIHTNDFDSASDVSESEDEMEIDSFDNNDDFRFYMGKDGESFWCGKAVIPPARARLKNTVKILPGPKPICRETPMEIDSFLKFISVEIIDNIVTNTNLFIDNKRLAVNYSRERDCKNTTRQEIMAVIGALFLIGVKHGGHANCKELWKDDGTGMLILRSSFSYKRFLFLLRSIRFDDLATRATREKTDKLAAIRVVYEDFVANCKNNYSMGEFATIDEMLLPFRGRCGWVQYMPNKPAKYGLKLYSCCDAKTFYTWNFELYCGKQKPGPNDVSNKPHDVVVRLTEGIRNSNRNITMDNWYTSVPLVETLLNNGLTAIGTLKKKKREIPPEFLSQNRVIGSCLYGFSYDMTLASIQTKPKKCVVILSSMHGREEIDLDSGETMINADYNATKGAVDTVDKMCAAYSTSRTTKRWPLAYFFRFLDMAGINAQIVYQHNNLEKVERRPFFLNNLAFQLMEAHLRIRAQVKSLPTDIRAFLERYRDQPVAVAHQSQQGPRSGPCHKCGKAKWNNTTVKCGSCGRFVCKTHSQRIVKCEKCNSGEEDASDKEE